MTSGPVTEREMCLKIKDNNIPNSGVSRMCIYMMQLKSEQGKGKIFE